MDIIGVWYKNTKKIIKAIGAADKRSIAALAAMAFSNKEWIGTKNAYKMGAVIFMVNMLMLVVGIPVAELLF